MIMSINDYFCIYMNDFVPNNREGKRVYFSFISGGFREGGALGAIAPILKKFCPYFPPEKVEKWVHITFDGRQIALFDLDRTHSPSDRIHSPLDRTHSPSDRTHSSPNRTPSKKS